MSSKGFFWRDRSATTRRTLGTKDAACAINEVRRALAEPSSVGPDRFIWALADVVEEGLWKQCEVGGLGFRNFGTWAVSPPPTGLGVGSVPAARLIRNALLEKGHIIEWVQILELIARRPGRPKTVANDDGFRFYTVSRASASKDRLLLVLQAKHPVKFQEVCAGRCSIFSAACAAGIVRRPSFSLNAAKKLNPLGQKALLCELFAVASIDVQCEFLERHSNVCQEMSWLINGVEPANMDN